MDSWLSKVIWISLHSSSHSFLPKGWTRTSIVGEGCSTMHRMQVDDAQILVFEVRLPGVSAFENHLEPFESPGELLKLTLFSLTPKRLIFNCSEGGTWHQWCWRDPQVILKHSEGWDHLAGAICNLRSSGSHPFYSPSSRPSSPSPAATQQAR